MCIERIRIVHHNPLSGAADPDTEILTLCARDPQLREFAFVLADNGHTHIGHVLSLHRCTLVDMADGQDWLADAILDHIERSNAQAGFSTDGWAPPPADTIDAALD